MTPSGSNNSNKSGYEPAYPSKHSMDPSIQEFVSEFFKISDSPAKTDDWVDCFRDGATLVMGNETAEGKQEIRKLRHGMWDKVEARKHSVAKVFPAAGGFNDDGVEVEGDDNDDDVAEFMMFGSVAYRLKTGEEASVDWAAHAQLRRRKVEGGGCSPWVFAHYRVYLQSAHPALGVGKCSQMTGVECFIIPRVHP
ncbi:hypothetical protein B0T17DRAFT_229977 [Bombardia bombarda]|uniref:Uncharacterized protein n=1 Tax=Bombardia bombarda TaxID=252184 RepID=A0AA40CA40_9PEZI|nr:hypothetical protein B0T17DRAFT_229977 [Bombardia bombarda]